MKQILQSLKSGATEVAEVPAPSVGPGQLLIRTTRSLISAGTERMLVEFGKANVLEKARQQPDKVRMVLDKVRTDGLVPTLDAVRNKLDQPLSLGYCNVGVVLEAGPGVIGYAPGDRVASNGKHAEIVSVPVQLCARVPDGVSDDQAAFTVLGAIALQGIRLAQPTLGESVVVTGLGLIGLLTVQLLRANGCRVLGIDLDAGRLALARGFGAETVDLSAGQDALAAAQRFSRGRGVDAVLVTAATQSDEPISQAAQMCRQRGRVVLVGVAGLNLRRDDFYKKEITLQVSSSYGPGRYDPAYEERGLDYPIGFVRWTEQRNLEALLDLFASGRLDVAPLITHRFAVDDAARAYAVVSGEASSLGILLEYPEGEEVSRARTVALAHAAGGQRGQLLAGAPSVSFIGSGNYATAVLIPAFRNAGARLRRIASQSGVSGLHAGRKYGFAETTTDVASVIEDPGASAIVVATRHDSHARLTCEALAAGKHVFVEKPLCLTLSELEGIESRYARRLADGHRTIDMVGFNRRFAPQIRTIKRLVDGSRQPMALVMTVNAGSLPADHWTQDRAVGGGRIVGEACHFIDLLRFLTGSPIVRHQRMAMRSATRDTASIQLEFEDGSIGVIHYLANGSKAFPKERLEVFTAGRVLQLDNFRRLSGYGWPGFRASKLWRQDKGQAACAAAFLGAVAEHGDSPIPFEELAEVSRVAIELAS
jgi:predicted dehydrogenase/threonine dehydrogenase-like Zn-dependent dehydrogenase